ncbi:hypothetical protein [Spirochaeta isovalerica]|uniref:Uncharacterized protein n=1 Tax=Spirochaeta isovalerica TaxID=150 RepID=A0A841R960_9SPIO|nr:hypothetical protein [Spirochaeta isovalerica]MBB6481854.1 hypothetical protein [Spirochaeta isovalerica]
MIILFPLASLLFNSCSQQPEKSDFYGSYKLIKIRQNGSILNIDTLAMIELTDELYTSAIDRNEDYELSEEEIVSVAYSFHIDDENEPYLIINKDPARVYLYKEEFFDLVLKKIDGLGNETVMYLKE